MDKITQENFEDEYVDSIEMTQIDKFVCDEMSRQIHRYIKGMSGTKNMMVRFEESLKQLTVPQKEIAIARYIDLNRKVLSGLDLKIVLTRAVANYTDTFNYFLTLINNKKKVTFYFERIKEKYVQFHEVYEENGKFGMKDHQGNILLHPVYDFLRTPYVYVDDLRRMPVIAQKDGKMGLVRADGYDTVAVPFEFDEIFLRDEYPYFEARKGRKKYLIEEGGTLLDMKG